jgi:hypothetical protein
MKRSLIIVAAIAVMVPVLAAYAHHSFTSTYHDEKTFTLKGKVVNFMFRNPHSFIAVEAPDDKGVMQRWGVEWGGAGQLATQNVNRYTLRAGDYVEISGRLGRSWEKDHRLLMQSLLRPSDGLSWGGRAGEVVD